MTDSVANGDVRGARVAVVMGVAGVGKTTVGRAVAERLGWDFLEGDAYHPESNVEKMERGIPLTDDDRREWLDDLRRLIQETLNEGRSAVLTCSALKESYRKTLLEGNEGTVVVYLKAAPDVVRERIRARRGHFFDPKLLSTQFAVLEEPSSAVAVDASRPVEEVVGEVVRVLTRPGA